MMMKPPETPEEFRLWREKLKLSLDEAADTLGLSRRTMYNYERSGPIPKTVALACVAVAESSQRRTENMEFFIELVKEQYPKLGEHVLVLPFIVERERTYSELIKIGLSEEAEEWIEQNTRTARFSMRTVVTADNRRRDVAVITFASSTECVYFKLRWC
jgi:transcriptional regulator with XRE-family HTH domain